MRIESAGQTVARLARLVERAVGEAELSLPQYRVLALLADGSKAASVLAERLAVKRPTVTGLMDGLVSRGLVERLAVAGDRRRVSHRLTAEGSAVLAKADAAADERLARLLAAAIPSRSVRAVAGLAAWREVLDERREVRARSMP